MGSSNSKLKNLKIDTEKWTKVDSNSQFDVMKSKEGNEGQLYHFLLDETMDMDKQVDIYADRANSTGNHVKVIGAETVSESIGLCGKSKTVNVLTQRIPTLLANIRPLNFQESNIVLYNALKGYSQISDKFGPIDVTDRMIGFNSQGKTKVWLNQNFGRNHVSTITEHEPGNISSLKNSSKNEKDMVHNIIGLIQKRSQRPFSEPYRTNIYQKENLLGCMQLVQTSGIVPSTALAENKINLGGQFENNNVILNKTSNNPDLALNNSHQFNQVGHTTYQSPRNINTKVTFHYSSPSTK